MIIIKFLIYFSISYVILCVPMGNKTLFTHLNSITAPYTKDIFTFTRKKAKRGIKAGKQFSKKLFSNSVPNKSDTSDIVESKYSAPKRGKAESNKDGMPQGSYTDQEKEFIKKILKKAQDI